MFRLGIFFILVCLINNLAVAEEVTASFKPVFLPFSIQVNNKGKVSIIGDTSFITPIGTFKIGVSKALIKRNTELILIIRTESGDKIYKIKDKDNIIIQLNFNSIINFKRNKVIIEARGVKETNIKFLESDQYNKLIYENCVKNPAINENYALDLNIELGKMSVNDWNQLVKDFLVLVQEEEKEGEEYIYLKNTLSEFIYRYEKARSKKRVGFMSSISMLPYSVINNDVKNLLRCLFLLEQDGS